MKKESIGLIFILGGITAIGFTWFMRNKPKLSDSQLADLASQSNAIKIGARDIDKDFEYKPQVLNAFTQNPYSPLSPISDAQQAQINKNVDEIIGCSMGSFLSGGVDCTNYNAQQQQTANPRGIATSGCNPPKLIITNVKRSDVAFPKPTDKASGWYIYFNLCGTDINQLYPISYKIIVIDSIGSQEIVKNNVQNTFGYLMDYLPRRPKSAVVTLSMKDKNGKSYIQTFNYKG
jgi:hypothetical protein